MAGKGEQTLQKTGQREVCGNQEPGGQGPLITGTGAFELRGSRPVAGSEREVMEGKNMEAREKNALGKFCLERNESYSLRVKQTK